MTVGVPVPAHRELVLAALDAGKHVDTEWPVGTRAAARSGRHTAVDLQARANPAAVRTRELVASAAIGRVLNVTVRSSTMAFGPTVTRQSLYLEDPASGMNLTTIQAAHTVDLALHVAGSLTSLAALRTVRYRDLAVSGADGDAPPVFHRTVPDHVLLQGRFADGGVLAVQVVGGRPPGDAPFRLDIQGELGTLTLEGGGDRGLQAGVMQLRRDGKPVVVPDLRCRAAHRDTQRPGPGRGAHQRGEQVWAHVREQTSALSPLAVLTPAERHQLSGLLAKAIRAGR